MRRSHNNFQLIDALVNCSDHLDPELAAEFITLSMEASKAHLDVILSTLPEDEQIRHKRLILQGSIILSLIRYGRS
jgi:hypothetical protein